MNKNKQQIKSLLAKNRIIEEALLIALEEGFTSISIRKIANKMNQSTGVIYHHFKNKEEIINAIQKKASEEISTSIKEAMKDKKTFKDTLEAVFYSVTKLAHKDGHRYQLILLHRYKNNNHQGALREMLEDHLIQAIRNGEVDIKIESVRNVALAIWSSFLGFHLMISQNQHLTDKEVKTLFQTQIQIVFNGILKKGGSKDE